MYCWQTYILEMLQFQDLLEWRIPHPPKTCILELDIYQPNGNNTYDTHFHVVCDSNGK